MTTATLVPTIVDEIHSVLTTFDYRSLDELADRLNRGAHVLVAGEGRSGFMAKAFAMRLMHLGLHVHVIGETTTPAVRAGDLLIAVSGSGTTASTVRTAEQAHAIGADVVAVTTDPESALADRADTVVHVPAATKYRKPGEAATIQPLSSLFDQVCHVMFDAVCLRLAQLRDVDNVTARAAHANTE
jgi:6-phospho-3-hexuloisomerase